MILLAAVPVFDLGDILRPVLLPAVPVVEIGDILLPVLLPAAVPVVELGDVLLPVLLPAAVPVVELGDILLPVLLSAVSNLQLLHQDVDLLLTLNFLLNVIGARASWEQIRSLVIFP